MGTEIATDPAGESGSATAPTTAAVDAAPMLPAGLPHPVGPRLMVQKGPFLTRMVVVYPDGTKSHEAGPSD
jgi:hypothetical protein